MHPGRRLSLLSSLFLTATMLLPGCSGSDRPGEARYVVVIGVDGMSPNGIREADTPNLDALMARGAHSFHARAVWPSSSSPNWASMIMGAGPEQHGITSNSWEAYDFTIAPTDSGLGPIFPSMFDVLRRERPESQIASVYDWGGFGRLYNKEAVTIDFDGDGPQETAAEAARVIRERKPTLTFVHFDHVDGAGHDSGHGSEAYNEAVAEADRLIGEIVAAVEAAGIAGETTLIVTSDHGGIGVQHGGETMEEMEIPWIIAGPGVKENAEIEAPIDTYDTAATVAYVLGLEPPYAWIGRPVLSAFEDAAPPAGPEPGVPGVEHVVVIGVDGMSPDGLQKARTPNLNRLIATGAHTFAARAVMTSSSSQNWASMIMGAGPEQHGITSNGWERDNFQIQPTAKGPEDLFPTMFSELRAARPDAEIVVVYDWGGFGRLFQKSVVDVDVDADGPDAAIDEALRQIEARKPALTFIHLDHVDHAGHEFGHGSDPYYASVEEADRMVGEVLDGLAAAGMSDNTLVIVTADHGGRGTGHGGESMGEMEIPWIAAGPGVVPGGLITDPVNTYDTACTVLYALGVAQPYAWVGRPVWAAFEATSRAARAATYVPAPRPRPVGGVFKGERPVVTLAVDDAEAVVRYTLDGTNPGPSSPVAEGPIALERSVPLRAQAFKGEASSPITVEQYRLLDANQEYGLDYGVYVGKFDVMPDFGKLKPTVTGRADAISIEAIDGQPEDDYAVLFRGSLDITTPGDYAFHMLSDDGSMLQIGDRVLIDHDGHGSNRITATISLEAGRFPLVVGYFETYGENYLTLEYEGPGIVRQEIPIDVLHPAGP